MHRVVFDTVVFVGCLINPRSIWGSVIFRFAEHYRLFVSPPVLEEILQVLQRPELSQKFRGFPGMDHAALLTFLSQAERVEIGIPPLVSRDPKDNKFLATAQAAHAAYLVTEDQDLLVLQHYDSTSIITTVEFLRILQSEVFLE